MTDQEYQEFLIRQSRTYLLERVRKMSDAELRQVLLDADKRHENDPKYVDQNGNAIPEDLVWLACGADDLTEEDLQVVMACVWYESGGVLLVSAFACENIVDDDPIDAGVNVNTDEILYVNQDLHRYDENGEFYHA
jgi:hypothetical protein